MSLSQDDIDLTKDIIISKMRSGAGWRPIQIAATNLVHTGGAQFEADITENWIDAMTRLWEEVQAGIDSGVYGSEFISVLAGTEIMNAASRFLQLTMNILSSPITLKLKTLPMFHLSYGSIFMRPVIVYINSNSMIKPFHTGLGSIRTSDLTGFDRVMSGMYLLTGFKHVINPKGSYSQFVLIRDPFEMSSYLFENAGTQPTDQPTVHRAGHSGDFTITK